MRDPYTEPKLGDVFRSRDKRDQNPEKMVVGRIYDWDKSKVPWERTKLVAVQVSNAATGKTSRIGVPIRKGSRGYGFVREDGHK